MKPLSFHWWRTVLYLIPSIAVYTIVLGTASLMGSLFERRGRFAHGCARTWSWLILATTGVSVDVRGLERLNPARTYIFVSNHQSIYDIPVIFANLPYQLRIIAKESLGSFPFLGLSSASCCISSFASRKTRRELQRLGLFPHRKAVAVLLRS